MVNTNGYLFSDENTNSKARFLFSAIAWKLNGYFLLLSNAFIKFDVIEYWEFKYFGFSLCVLSSFIHFLFLSISPSAVLKVHLIQFYFLTSMLCFDLLWHVLCIHFVHVHDSSKFYTVLNWYLCYVSIHIFFQKTQPQLTSHPSWTSWSSQPSILCATCEYVNKFRYWSTAFKWEMVFFHGANHSESNSF